MYPVATTALGLAVARPSSAAPVGALGPSRPLLPKGSAKQPLAAKVTPAATVQTELLVKGVTFAARPSASTAGLPC